MPKHVKAKQVGVGAAVCASLSAALLAISGKWYAAETEAVGFGFGAAALCLALVWVYCLIRDHSRPRGGLGREELRRERLNLLAPLIARGNAIREAVPPNQTDPEAVNAWDRGLDEWCRETEAYLSGVSQIAAVRFLDVAGITREHLPRVHHDLHTSFLVLERRLRNLHAITEGADIYLSDPPPAKASVTVQVHAPSDALALRLLDERNYEQQRREAAEAKVQEAFRKMDELLSAKGQKEALQAELNSLHSSVNRFMKALHVAKAFHVAIDHPAHSDDTVEEIGVWVQTGGASVDEIVAVLVLHFQDRVSYPGLGDDDTPTEGGDNA